MNISIEDIKYLEKKYKEKPTNGKVWELAKEGKTFLEIKEILSSKTKRDFYQYKKLGINND